MAAGKPITQAAILAAGFGTRLRPITDTVPKVMVPIAGRPLLEHTIRLLKKQGIRQFILNVHYLPEVIRSYFGDGSRLGVEVRYSDETERLMDTGGALKQMEPWLADDFLLLYGDHLHAFDFRPVMAMHRDRQSLATLVLKRSDAPQNGEVLEIDPAGRILAFHTRPHGIVAYTHDGMFLNSGLYVLSKTILGNVPPATPIHLDKQILPELWKSGAPLYGYPTDADILDIGTPEKYRYAEAWHREHQQLF